MWIEQYCLETYSILLNIFLKHNKRWTVLSFGQNVQQRLYWLNCFVFWSKFYKMTIWIEWFKPYCLLVKIFLKANMDWTVLSFSENFLKRQYGLNRIVLWSKFFSKDNMSWTIFSFGENTLKRQYRLHRIVFYWRFSYKTIWFKS